MNYQKLWAAIDHAAPVICTASDRIFDAAEPGFHETVSGEILAAMLEDRGFAVERGIDGMPTAFRASYGYGRPVIALLAEYDALANVSQAADVTVKQPVRDGAPGHCCGHNLLGAGTAAAAIGIQSYLDAAGASGTVVVFGCPAEEGGFSKAYFVRDGLMDDVDAALAWHPYTYDGIFAEQSLANYHTLVRYRGVSAHAAASPEKGRSALDAMELLNIGLNFLREHIPSDSRMHYAFLDAGGPAPNVVPAFVEGMYEIRSPRVDDLRDIQARFLDAARGAALMTGTELEYEIFSGVAGLLPNRTLFSRFLTHLEALPSAPLSEAEAGWARTLQATMPSPETSLNEFLDPLDAPRYPTPGELYYQDVIGMPGHVPMAFGSTDVGDVSMVCPTGIVCTNTWMLGTQGHSWQVAAQGKSAPAKRAMLRAAKVLAATAADLYDDPALLARAKAEFDRRSDGKQYASLLPADLKPRL